MSSNLVFIIDTSYSISHFIDNYLDSINRIINTQISINPETRFSIITFNDREKYICINEKIGQTRRKLTRDDLQPTGCTALYDSVSAILNYLCKFGSRNNEDEVLAVIITDGDDTSSKLLNKKHLALQIARNKSWGWKFVYLGVNENSIQFGKDLGCNVAIHYNTSAECMNFLPNIFRELFNNKIINTEIDVEDLMKNLANLKV